MFAYFNKGILNQCFFLNISRSVSPSTLVVSVEHWHSLIRVPLCHIAYTHRPSVANRSPSMPPGHPTPPSHCGPKGVMPLATGHSDYRRVLERPACPSGPALGTTAFTGWVSHRQLFEPVPSCLPPLWKHTVRLPLPASQSWASWSHYLRSLSLAFTTTPNQTVVSTVFLSVWTPLVSLRKLSHFLSSLLRFTHLAFSCLCPAKASQPGEVGHVSCFACWLHPLTSGNCTSFCFETPSSIHCRQCCRGSGNHQSREACLPLARSWHVTMP